MKALYKNQLYTVQENDGNGVALLKPDGSGVMWILFSDPNLILDPTDGQVMNADKEMLNIQDLNPGLRPRKPFGELTREELVALTDADILFYRDRMAAERAIPLLGPEPVPPTGSKPQKDAPSYKLTIAFQHRQDAEEVARFAEKFQRWELGYKSIQGIGYESVASPDFDPITVYEETYYTEAFAARIASAIEAFNTTKKSYDQEMEEYRRIAGQHAEIAREIAMARGDAQAQTRRIQEYEALFDRYFELAERNRRIACKFMSDAKRDAAQIIPHKFAPDEVGPMPGSERRIDLNEV